MHILGRGQKSHVLMYIENEWIRKQVLKDKVLANPKRVNVLELEGTHTFLVFAYPYEDWDKIIKHLDASTDMTISVQKSLPKRACKTNNVFEWNLYRMIQLS